MNATDKKRLYVILVVLFLFGLPLLINGPLSTSADQPMIPLGLDLKGGVDVQIIVDTDDLARQILERNKFDIRGDLTRVLQGSGASLLLTPEGEDPGLELKLSEPAENATAVAQTLQQFVEEGWLAPINAEELATAAGTVLHLDEDYLYNEVQLKIQQAAKIVKERVDALGVAQSDVRVEGEDAIRVQLPGTSQPDVIQNLVRPAMLEFSLLYNTGPVRTMTDELSPVIDPNGGELLPGARLREGYVLRYHSLEQDDSIGGYEGTATVLRRGRETEIPVEWFLVEQDASIRGEHLRTVAARPDAQNPTRMVISFELNGRGTRIFRDVTEANVGRRLAILLEHELRSAPEIQEAIPYGQGQISGNFDVQEAMNLENVLKTGALPARLISGETSTVGATLGEESIRAGLKASIYGALAVVAFMLWYYNIAGVLAVIAVLVNVFLVLGMLSLVRATLTLPGIAGIILTIGMAVDANVLIFERVREETKAGKSLRNAILHGFRNAFSAIVDANVTTMITALVLLQFGFGPIRGFALTMTFGIVATLFTGLFVTQALMGIYFSMKDKLPLGNGMKFFEKSHMDFMKMRRFAFVFSMAVILLCVARIGYGGLNLGVDFSGGVQVEVAVAGDVSRQAVEDTITGAGFEDPRVQTIDRAGRQLQSQAPEEAMEPGGATTVEGTDQVSSFLVRLASSQLVPADGLKSAEMATADAVVAAIGDGLGGAQVELESTRLVTPETGTALGNTAIFIAVVAMLFIFIYVGMRFNSVYGWAALVALLHDVFITLGVVTWLNVDLSLDVVAALLTILGYSLNDTIVVFDRIRENRRHWEGRDLKEVINISINQVLNRTVITTLTTLLAVVVLFSAGGPGVHDFSRTLLIGFIVGTYSSIFVAAPFVYGRLRKRQLAEAKSA